MNVGVILAAGNSSRFQNEVPKQLYSINNKPIIWHLMNIFCLQGLSEFIISTGYKSEVIDNWVQNNKILY